MPTLNICVIIPAFNEAKVIENTVLDIKKLLDKTSYNYEIVVVNDSSSDNTAHNAKKAGATVVSHILNSGAGGATATGLRYAREGSFDIAATMDADGQHAPDDVILGINTIANSKTDLLIGSRLIDSKGMSKVKILGNKGLSLITSFLFGSNVTDSQSGLRMYSKNAITNLSWKTTGYEFCSEMLWRAKQQHMVITEYPIKAIYSDYSTSKGQNNWNAINIVKSLIKRRIVEIFE